MLQKFMDGKKKYSAFIITVLATMVPLFVQEPEAQKTILDMVPSVAAFLAGVFYIVTQGGVDKEKEKARAAEVQAVIAANGGVANGKGGAAAQPTQPQQPAAAAILQVEEPPVTFDPKSFHESVLADVEGTHKEMNPCTIFYEARNKGQVTKCQHISQAVDYWYYLVDLVVDARDWLKEETEKKVGECGRSPEFYVFTRDFNTIMRAANQLGILAASKIDWRSKLAAYQRTLYGVGILAEQILAYSTK